MDVCLAKQGFPFDDPTLIQLTSHLGGGSSILRIGGSDQNSFYYDLTASAPMDTPFSARTGGKCCANAGSCHGCVKDCTMPAVYWESMVKFAEATGHRFMFGLVPETRNAESLVSYSAKRNLPVHAYTFGNEVDSAEVTAGYPVLRQILSNTSMFPRGTAPLLAGPDVALQRHASIDVALANKDETINTKLKWVCRRVCRRVCRHVCRHIHRHVRRRL